MCIFGSFIVFEQVWSPNDIVSRTSPLRHLYWRDTRFGPRKNVHTIIVFVTSNEQKPLFISSLSPVPPWLVSVAAVVVLSCDAPPQQMDAGKEHCITRWKWLRGRRLPLDTKRPLQRKDQIRYRATRNTMIAIDWWILKPQLLLMDFYPARHAET